MGARLFVLVALAAGIAPAFAQDIQRTNCDLSQNAYRLAVERRERNGPGPFRLVATYCHYQMPEAYYSTHPAIVVSPDTSSIAVRYMLNYSDHGIAMSRLSSPAVDAAHSHDVGTLALAPLEAHGAFRWSADSQTLWSATQNHMRPTGGWALGPVRPLRVENGIARELPDLSHPAGPLDALLWTDDGRVLALFGARGDSYRPQVPNPDPTLAFADAVNGRVIESLPLRAINPTAGENQAGLPGPFIRAAEVIGLRDGRLRAFLSVLTPVAARRPYVSSWVVWTQGEPLRVQPDPYPPADIATAVSADGARVLITRNLQVNFECIEPARGCRAVGPPVEGVLAALHDLETGRAIWSYRTRVTILNTGYPTPELSDDGRYALIGLPPSDPVRYDIALISARDGSVVQRFPIEQGGKPTFGFARGSRRMWISLTNVTTVYELR